MGILADTVRRMGSLEHFWEGRAHSAAEWARRWPNRLEDSPNGLEGLPNGLAPNGLANFFFIKIIICLMKSSFCFDTFLVFYVKSGFSPPNGLAAPPNGLAALHP